MILKSVLPRTIVALAGVLILLVGSSAHAATLKVNTKVDETTGANCSLREAVAAINQGSNGNGCKNAVSAFGTLDPYGTSDTINVPAFTISLSGGSIQVLKAVTIQGAGYLRTIIETMNMDEVNFATAIRIGDNGTNTPFVFMSDLTIQNSAPKSGINEQLQRIGGLEIDANATLEFRYGRILDTGDTDNSAGCISNAGGSVYLESSELRGCRSSQGGGIGSRGFLSVSNSTIHECLRSAGILSSGTTYIFNSTIANNTTDQGNATGVNLSGFAHLEGVTIAYNQSTMSAPALFFTGKAGDTLEIKASIVAKNASGGQSANCGIGSGSPAITSLGFNILGDMGEAPCPKIDMGNNTDIQTDPNFVKPVGATFTFLDGSVVPAPIAAGGVGPVYVPHQGSPATSVVPTSDSFCQIGMFDERSLARAKDENSACDIGAVSRSSALFVFATANVGGKFVESNGDKVVGSTLTNLGFDVTPADVTHTKVTSDMAMHKAIVVVSKSTVNTGFAPATFRDVTAGVLVMNRLIYGAMMMVDTTAAGCGANCGTDAGQTNVSIDTTFGFLGAFGDLIGDRGTPAVTTSGQMYGWGVPAAGSTFVAEANMTNNAAHRAIFSYFQGSQMSGNFLAPGVRVGFFATQGASGALTTAGQRLLEEAIVRTTQVGAGD
ncbi:MAG TPA: CSLREA domain-containing protein [Terriglobales bacterium]|jgi:CSLREA domain-containing protein|nr:CSLREA domain-containing protein [Terriglobales bacterium]